MSKLVSLKYLCDYDSKLIQNALKNAIAEINCNAIIKPKMKVLIKACLPSDASPDLAETTHPAVVAAIANYIKDLGAECVVADSPYKKYSLDNLERVYLNTGMLDVANQTSCVLNKDLSTAIIETPNGVMTKSLTLLDIINKVDVIINVGKLKIDEKLGYLGVASNLFGLVPGEMKTQVFSRINTQKDFHNYILDIYDAIKDKLVLNILDGIVAQEHDKTQRMLYCMAVSDNMFSLDASVVDILDIGYKNTVLRSAKERGLFEFDKGYKLVGEKLDKFKLEDFNMQDFHETSSIHKNLSQKVRYYKKHQVRTKINPDKCKGCSVCSKICPTGAITMKTDKNGELFACIDYNKCIYCNKCRTACPYQIVDTINPIGNRKLIKELEKQNQQQ